MPTNYTFEQRYKLAFKSQLETVVGNALKVLATNDISQYAAGRIELAGDEVIAILQTGQGRRILSDTALTVQQSLFVQIYVPINYLQEILANLSVWTKTQSDKGNVQSLMSGGTPNTLLYSYYVDFAMPSTDGQLIRLGSKQYAVILLTGDLIYSDIALTFADEITLKMNLSGTYTNIANIRSWNWQTSMIGEQIVEGSLVTTKQLLNGSSGVLSFDVLFDSTQAIHRKLKEYSYKPTFANMKQSFQLIDNSVSSAYTVAFDGILSVTILGSANQLTVLRCTVNVTGAIS